jgi:hypothetical protein
VAGFQRRFTNANRAGAFSKGANRFIGGRPYVLGTGPANLKMPDDGKMALNSFRERLPVLLSTLHAHDLDGSLSSLWSSDCSALLLQLRQDLIPWDSFAAVEFVETRLNLAAHFVQLSCAEPVLVLEQPQPFADDFARGLITAALHFARNEFFKFGRE